MMSQIEDARNWLSDVFPNSGFDSFRELPDGEVWVAIDRNYDGGILQFAKDGDAKGCSAPCLHGGDCNRHTATHHQSVGTSGLLCEWRRVPTGTGWTE